MDAIRSVALAVALASAPSVAAPVDPPPSRRAVVKHALAQAVRVVVYDGTSARRTASGVAIATEIKAGEPTTYIITNAHVADTKGWTKPRYGILSGEGPSALERKATLTAVGKAPEMDLAILEVAGVKLPCAQLAPDEELELGDDVVAVAAPYGKALSVAGGLLSHVEWDPDSRRAEKIKTDAAIGYGASGGGLYSVETGKLVAIIEGYRTAKINFAVGDQPYSFDVPMPGETFCAPPGKIRRFLANNGLSRLVSAAPLHADDPNARNER